MHLAIVKSTRYDTLIFQIIRSLNLPLYVISNSRLNFKQFLVLKSENFQLKICTPCEIEIFCCQSGFIGECVGFSDRECMVWYMLFIIFVPYAMLPLPLKWCMVGGTISGSAHLIFISVEKFEKNNVSLNYFHKIFELKTFFLHTGLKMHCTPTVSQLFAIFSNQFCGYVHEVFDGPWAAIGVH